MPSGKVAIAAGRPCRRRQDREQVLIVGIVRRDDAGARPRRATMPSTMPSAISDAAASAASGRADRASAHPQFRVEHDVEAVDRPY